MRTSGSLWMMAFVWLLVTAPLAAQEPTASSGVASAGSERASPRAGFAFVGAEFMSHQEVEAALPLLATFKVGVVLSWPSSEVDNPLYYALVRKAAALGVEVRPWLLLPEEQGYWPNSKNAEQFVAEAGRLLARWRAESLAPGTFIIDMEMPIARTRRYADLLRAYQNDAVLAFLKAGIDRREYAIATRVYREFVEHAHELGFRVELSTLSQVLDDYLDGDDGLRQAFNIPVAGIPWDSYFFQVYRTLNQDVLGPVTGPTTSYYVYDYASRARALFGARAGVSLGLTDPGELLLGAPVYRDGRDLRADLDAARAAGIGREGMLVYNLRGIVRRTPSEQWFPQSSLFVWAPLPDLATVLTRASTMLFDLSL